MVGTLGTAPMIANPAFRPAPRRGGDRLEGECGSDKAVATRADERARREVDGDREREACLSGHSFTR